MTTREFVNRKFKIDKRHDDALKDLVEEEGKLVTEAFIVNLALEAYLHQDDDGDQTSTLSVV